MAEGIAIIAGRGTLPHEVATALDAPLFVTFVEVDGVSVPEGPHLSVSFTRFGAMFDGLRAHGINKVVFAGALTRPVVDPSDIDAKTAEILPRFAAALDKGDDGLLREVIAIFEGEGFGVLGAGEVAPELVAGADLALGAPDVLAASDIKMGFGVLVAMAPLDISQAIVVEKGQVLGLETLQGTDALLDFVAATKPALRRGKGVLVKTAKDGQDLRIDMPTIGPATVEGVAKAGLAGIAVKAGAVLVLERQKVAHLVQKHGLFLEIN